MSVAFDFSAPPRTSSAHRSWAILVLILLLGIFHGALAPFAPGAAGAGAALQPPSLTHPFGTDILGRDLWSESVHALGVTITAAWLGTLVVLLLGPLGALIAAHLLGSAAAAARLAATVLAAVPALLLGVLFSALMLPGSAAIAAGLAVAPTAFLRRYDEARAGLATPYSDFARASGVSAIALLRRDLRHDLRYGFTRTLAGRFAAVTAVFSTMSFFGFGAVPPHRDLGLMIASARAELPDAWWTAAGPAALLVLLLLVARSIAAWPDEGRG